MRFSQLPDEAWIAVFDKLTPAERHTALPLVSRRCWRLLCSPQLLNDFDVALYSLTGQQTVHLRSLVLFLARRAAGHVRRLSLWVPRPDSQDYQEHGALFAAAALSCHGLVDFSLCAFPNMALSSWLAPLAGSLQRLTLAGSKHVEVASLDFLTALEDLQIGLGSDSIFFDEDARLPTSLTHLVVGNGYEYDLMPSQIGQLSRLHHLRFVYPYSDDASFAPLTRLPLTRLDLLGVVRTVPSCLSALTSLQSLTVHAETEGDWLGLESAMKAANMCAALPRLSRLTFLALSLSTASPLQHLTALPSLRNLCWRLGNAAAPLPPGAWLAGLESLAAPLPLLAANLSLLSAASRLEEICVYSTHLTQQSWPLLQQLLRWAPRQPRLRRLLLGLPPELASLAWAEVAATSRAHPALHIKPGYLDPFSENAA